MAAGACLAGWAGKGKLSRANYEYLEEIDFSIDYSTPTMTLAVDMQIDALACNAGLREGSLPT